MANELLAQHGPVKLWLQEGLGLRQHTVTIDDDGQDRFIVGVQDLAKAKTYANAAHKAMKTTNAEDRVAVGAHAALRVQAAERAAELAREYRGTAEDWMAEALAITINQHLGLCPDGCCGGMECLPEEEWPAWKAWQKRLGRVGQLVAA